MHDQEVALVTGANKGIGLEIARQLAARGLTVLAGARDPAKVPADLTSLQLDVTDAASIARAAEHIRARFGRLDVLVNNAGIVLPAPTEHAQLDNVRQMFEVNVFGAIAVTQAMLPLLREAPVGRIVMVSSRAGSLTTLSAPGYAMRGLDNIGYGASKSALNAVVIRFAHALEGTRVKVNAACPGHVATDLNEHKGPRTVQQGAAEPVRLAMLGLDGHTGGFSNDGGPVPW